MNVLQLISSKHGFYGAERLVVLLSAELRQMGIRPIVGVFRDDSTAAGLDVLDRARTAGLETAEIRCQGRLDRAAVGQLRALLEQRQIDVLHSHGPKPNLYGRLAARGTEASLVATCHTWHITSAKEWLVSAVDRAVLRGFDSVVLVSEHLRRKVRRAGIPDDRIWTIDNGVDCRTGGSSDGDLREDLGCGENLVAGVVARLAPEKGLDYLVDAAAILVREFPRAVFLVVGDGPERKALERRARASGVLPQFRFLGNRTDTSRVYATFDVFVLPSLSEGMPMTVLEAMVAGKAIVATRVGSVSRVIADGQTGLLVPPRNASALADRLGSLLRDRSSRARLGAAARAAATREYSAARMAGRYAEVYARSLTSNRGPQRLAGSLMQSSAQ